MFVHIKCMLLSQQCMLSVLVQKAVQYRFFFFFGLSRNSADYVDHNILGHFPYNKNLYVSVFYTKGKFIYESMHIAL